MSSTTNKTLGAETPREPTKKPRAGDKTPLVGRTAQLGVRPRNVLLAGVLVIVLGDGKRRRDGLPA